jgi:hypothetical protein
MHAVTEFCCLSQQITLNQDCMPGHAWICMRIADACMQRLGRETFFQTESRFGTDSRHFGGLAQSPDILSILLIRLISAAFRLPITAENTVRASLHWDIAS